MKNILAAATIAALAGASGAANAADIYSPAAGLKDTPYVVAPSWTGFYAGANVGGGFSDLRSTFDAASRNRRQLNQRRKRGSWRRSAWL